MSIWDEANKLKRQRQQEEDARHQRMLKSARLIIPNVANYVKEEVIKRASQPWAEDKLQYKRTGFFKTECWLPIQVSVGDYDDKSRIGQWGRVLYECPEVYDELIAAIEAKGLSDVTISRDAYDYAEIYVRGKLMK